MPFRSIASPTALRFQRAFHYSAVRRTYHSNHYETLQVATTAGPQDIKKAFYSLSKTHHPDRNPDDPEASARFVKISNAYAVLGTPAKRQQYDREVMRISHHTSTHVPQGSYYSSGPAGGRTASGLSRRRTQFQGPPTSFYRNGGWGEHTEKRQAAQGDPTAHIRAAGGMGHGQLPFGQEADVPHFNREGHTRTHVEQDKRRRRKVDGDYIPPEPPRGVLGDFLLVSGILTLTLIAPGFIYGTFTGRPTTDKRKGIT